MAQPSGGSNPHMAKFQEALKKAGKSGPAGRGGGAPPSSTSRPSGRTTSRVKLEKKGPVILGEVLVVEPDRRVGMMVGNQLATLKFKPKTVGSGAEALEAVKESVPRLLLVDANLPDMSGGTCTSRIRALPGAGEVPVILVTEREDEASRNAAIMVGANEIAAKPFRLPELMRKVRLLTGLE